MLTDADDMLSEVKVLGVEAEQAEPQLANGLCVCPKLGPATGLQEEGGKTDILGRPAELKKGYVRT